MPDTTRVANYGELASLQTLKQQESELSLATARHRQAAAEGRSASAQHQADHAYSAWMDHLSSGAVDPQHLQRLTTSLLNADSRLAQAIEEVEVTKAETETCAQLAAKECARTMHVQELLRVSSAVTQKRREEASARTLEDRIACEWVRA